MANFNKTLVGFTSFLAITLATAGSVLVPTDASALAKRVDTLNVYVTRNYPNISFSSINSDKSAPATISAAFSYDHAENVDFIISSIDAEGNRAEVSAGSFVPKSAKDSIDGSGRQTVSFDLPSLGLEYGNYTLTARSNGSYGYAEDTIEFAYTPVDVSVLSTLEAAASNTTSASKSNNISKAFLATSSTIMTAVLISGLVILKRAEKRETSKRRSSLPKGSLVLSRGVATFM
jgi:hypothetical protein